MIPVADGRDFRICDSRRQILLGIAIGALLSAISDIGEWGSIVFLLTSFILVCAALFMGPRLKVIYRVALVFLITYFSYCMTLQGRTMSVGLKRQCPISNFQGEVGGDTVHLRSRCGPWGMQAEACAP